MSSRGREAGDLNIDRDRRRLISAGLANILCIEDERVVSGDNTVRQDGRTLQIPEQKQRRRQVKARIRVHAYPDDRLAICQRPRRLARYQSSATL